MISHSESYEAEDAVKVRVDGCSGTIILNNVNKRNAINRAMLEQLREALGDLHQEKRVRGVIVTGNETAFSSGTDLTEIRETMGDNDPQQTWFADSLAQKELIEQMLRFPKPIVSAVNGPALGFGATMVLASDLVVGTAEATFGFPETQRGLVPGLAAPLLAFRLGSAAAADFLLRAEVASAEDCSARGIYHWLVDADLVWAKADAIIRDLCAKDPSAISMTKRLLNETIGENLFTQLSAGAAATASARTTAAAKEGVESFLEKRDPEWP